MSETYLKNRDADLTNPNLYHSIEDFKEHLYDEIKNLKPPGKYSILFFF